MLRTLIPSLLTAAAVAIAAPVSAQVFLAQSDVIVVEMESSGAPGDWNNSTSTPGFTGESYIEWTGPNLFGTPGQGIFFFDFEVQEGGQWLLNVRNRHENSDATEENDVWIQMDNGPWIKTFSNMPGSVGAWTWESRFDFSHNNQPQASYNLSPGVHRITFSGRSFGFKMDRFHLHRPNAINPLNPNLPESPVRFGNSFGAAVPNSTGQASRVEATGSPAVIDNNTILTTIDLPENVPGFFLVSRMTGFVSNPGGSAGNLLLGGSIGRLPVTASTANGSASSRLLLDEIPTPLGSEAASAGDTYNFQFWHRDLVGNTATSNFSRGLTVTFE